MRCLSGLIALALLSSGCIRAYATGVVADALSASGGSYGRDNDPELVAAAIPFGLKTMEAVLVERPEHRGLLTALASGFVQYGVAFVSLPAERIMVEDLERGHRMKARAKKLFLRARDYGLRGLEVGRPQFGGRVRSQATQALAELGREDVPLIYWTAAAWGSAVAADKTDAGLIADLPVVQALADRAIALDPDWGRGALEELWATLETVRPGGQLDRARAHYERAVELAGGSRAGTFVALAEAIAVKEQKVADFRAWLGRALAIDVDAFPDDRLGNMVMQEKARFLEARAADLFLDAGEGEADPATP